MRPLLLATTNPGKIRELAEALAAAGFALRGLAEAGIAGDAPESGSTFEANARQKADHYLARAGIPVLAEDSGLCVDALGGAPGVHSARYGAGAGIADDDARTAHLLRALEGVTPPRTARYECVMVLAGLPGGPLVSRGAVAGEILAAPRGRGGFGYDPVFFYPPYGRTFAECAPEEKAAVSHRGAALRDLLRRLGTGPDPAR